MIDEPNNNASGGGGSLAAVMKSWPTDDIMHRFKVRAGAAALLGYRESAKKANAIPLPRTHLTEPAAPHTITTGGSLHQPGTQWAVGGPMFVILSLGGEEGGKPSSSGTPYIT